MSLVSTHTNGICSNGYLGDVSITASGQTGPYTYLWNNVDTNQNIFNRDAGTYTVRVTDSYGCTATSTQTVTVSKQTADYSTINSSFLNYSIVANSYIWFSGVLRVKFSGVPAKSKLLYNDAFVLSTGFTSIDAKLVVKFEYTDAAHFHCTLETPGHDAVHIPFQVTGFKFGVIVSGTWYE